MKNAGWISVKDFPPNDGEIVFVHDSSPYTQAYGNRIMYGKYSKKEKHWTVWSISANSGILPDIKVIESGWFIVTHWTSISEPKSD